MNLDAIRERAARCEEARSLNVLDCGVAAIESAADVPALLEEIGRLRAALMEERAAHAKADTEVRELRDLALALTEARDEARAELRQWRTTYGGIGVARPGRAEQ